MTETQTIRNRRFTSSRGNAVEVFETREVGRNATGFRGIGRTVRTFAVVAGTEVEVETGCSFRAESAVKAAGF